MRHAGATGGPPAATEAIWAWLAAPEHRALLTLWLEAYARALVERDGVWAGFAARTVREWLGLLAELGPADDDADRTLLLAVLRGCLLDLLATGDVAPHRRRCRALPAPGRDRLRAVTAAAVRRG